MFPQKLAYRYCAANFLVLVNEMASMVHSNLGTGMIISNSINDIVVVTATHASGAVRAQVLLSYKRPVEGARKEYLVTWTGPSGANCVDALDKLLQQSQEFGQELGQGRRRVLEYMALTVGQLSETR